MDAPHLPHGDNPWAQPPADPPAGPPQHLVPPQPTAHHAAWPQPVPYAYPVANPAYGRPAPPWWTQHPAYWQPPRRSTGRRLAILAGMAGGWLATAFAFMFVGGMVLGASVNPAAYPTDEAYDAAFDARFEQAWPWIFGGSVAALWVVGLVVVAVLAPKVRYRWFDTFLQLVPVYGWYFTGKILWRCTDLAQWKPPATNPWAPPPYASPPPPPY